MLCRFPQDEDMLSRRFHYQSMFGPTVLIRLVPLLSHTVLFILSIMSRFFPFLAEVV